MDIQEIRLNILRELYQAYHQEGGRGELERGELEQRLKITSKQLQGGLGYLLDKKYVRSIPLSIGSRTLSFLQITSDGIDIVENNKGDPQITTVESAGSGGVEGETKPQIFLCYARQDEGKVENLYQKLASAGFKPWMDKHDILPGEPWESTIQKAIRDSDFFLACLSTNSVNRRGVIQKEIKQALEIWKEKLDSDIYFIPVRLDNCEVTESLSHFQWVDLFEKNGWARLSRAIEVGVERLQK